MHKPAFDEGVVYSRASFDEETTYAELSSERFEHALRLRNTILRHLAYPNRLREHREVLWASIGSRDDDDVSSARPKNSPVGRDASATCEYYREWLVLHASLPAALHQGTVDG